MTIITKPLSEKKGEKIAAPFINVEKDATIPQDDVESQGDDLPRFLILRGRARRVSNATTLCLLVAALAVVGIGILGGMYLYRQYLRSQTRFKGWCAVPYNDANQAMLLSQSMNEGLPDRDAEVFMALKNDENNNFNQNVGEFLEEEFEIDLEKESYEKINVPDFRDGRSGRFIHDFNTNTTGIIDLTGKRCFVMPLNRDMVLPPRSLFDLIQKMWDGYYKVNTEIVRETMKVVIPPLSKSDLQDIGTYISKECVGFPVYRMEKFVGGVVKRSVDPQDQLKFAQFSGSGIVELDIVNINEAKVFEENHVN